MLFLASSLVWYERVLIFTHAVCSVQFAHPHHTVFNKYHKSILCAFTLCFIQNTEQREKEYHLFLRPSPCLLPKHKHLQFSTNQKTEDVCLHFAWINYEKQLLTLFTNNSLNKKRPQCFHTEAYSIEFL
jgi:hypothetical protein